MNMARVELGNKAQGNACVRYVRVDKHKRWRSGFLTKSKAAPKAGSVHSRD
jgi:hypothetical protein